MDYKSFHLSWIKSHPQFVPQYSYDLTIPYLEVMTELYRVPDLTQDLAQMFWQKDIQHQKNYENAVLQTLKTMQVDPLDIFVTIGFNHQTWTIAKCVEVIKTVRDLPWVNTFKAVFELHRENGEHPHVHMYITTVDKMPKSKVLEKLWAVKGIKKIVLQKSFIDYKLAEDYHIKYINLEKKDSKMSYVDKDREWRIKNNIPEVFEK